MLCNTGAVLMPSTATTGYENCHNKAIVDRSSDSVYGDVSTTTPDVVDVMFGQGYTHA